MQHEAQGARRRRGVKFAATAFALVVVASAAVGALTGQPDASPPEVTQQQVDDRPPGLRTTPALRPQARHAAPRLEDDPAPAVTADAEDRPAATVSSAAATLTPAEPQAIVIPALGVDAAVMDLGLHEDGTMEVPPHAPRPESRAGWFRHSPTPGALGPSIIVGHVDSDRHGPSVFYGLADLAEGDTIEVVRADGVTAVFAVEHTAQYGKDRFPSDEVYGNIDHAGLRLITCGGDFDTDRMEYSDNIVVYAELVDSHPSP